MGKTAKDRRINSVLSVVLTIICILWMYPVFMILMNSLKTERAITTTHAFELPTAETFVGLKNYIYGIAEMDFLSSLWYSFIITMDCKFLLLAGETAEFPSLHVPAETLTELSRELGIHVEHRIVGWYFGQVNTERYFYYREHKIYTADFVDSVEEAEKLWS